jgi:radical SAM superfamily enzyme YgiQ (UPF0313 family)
LDLFENNFLPESVSGLCYRENGEIKQNKPHKLSSNLDDFGFPSHDKIPIKLYKDPFMERGPMTVTYSSRGCINKPPCIMCSACFYENNRYRSIESLLEEFHWIESLGIKEIRFPFEGGFNNTKLACELFDRMIAEKIDLRWTCNGRADYLPNHLLEKMKKAGCKAINIGCESADLKILSFARKKVTPDQVSDAVKRVKENEMDVLVYFILGLPFESKETIKQTLSFAKKLPADMVTFGIATPHPETEFFRYLDRNNYLETRDWSKYDPMLPPVFSYPELSSKEIYDETIRCYRSFYLRPTYIAKRVLKLNTPSEIKNNFKNLIAFVQRYVLT